MSLTPDQLEAWINALRSDEYEQGAGQLKKRTRYCCLGVLCEAVLGVDLTASDADKFGNVTFGDLGGLEEAPDELEEALPLEVRSYLADWNDIQELSFEDIALRLEESAEELCGGNDADA